MWQPANLIETDKYAYEGQQIYSLLIVGLFLCKFCLLKAG